MHHTKKCLILLLAIFGSYSLSFALSIQGTVTLDNSSNHSDITISFIAKSPSAVNNSTITNSLGQFSINIVAGLYDIEYSKQGYQTEILNGILLSADQILSSKILSSKSVQNVSGNIFGVWKNDVMYNVIGDINIPLGKSLTIDEGTIIQFTGYYSINVYGKLIAEGKEGNKIVFTSNKENKMRGDWAGVSIFTSQNDTTKFSHCIIEYGASKIVENALLFNNGNTLINNCIIRGSSYGGIYTKNGGYTEVSKSEIYDCYYYGIASGSSAKESVIVNNRVHHIDLIGISCAWTVTTLKNNWVYNTGYNGIQTWGFPRIENNILFNNIYGIFVVADKPLIKNNTIAYNTQGIGFYDSDFWKPTAIITSNIIYNNTNYGIYSEGIYGPEKVEYNLIHGNPSGIANKSFPVGLGQVITTSSTGHPSDTYYNIFLNPSLVTNSPDSELFPHLTNTSPAINSGDPQYKNCDQSIVDCGAIQRIQCDQLITFNSLENKRFGDKPFLLTAQSTSNLSIHYSSSNTSVAIIKKDSLIIVGVGETIITASQPGNDNFYAGAPVTQALKIDKKLQTIIFQSPSATTYGDPPLQLNVIASSGLEVKLNSLSDNVQLSQNIVLLLAPGRVTIKAVQSGNDQIESAQDVNQTFCVNPPKPIISKTNSSNSTISSNSVIGNQWFRNGALLENETNPTLEIKMTGTYTVQVSIDGCTSQTSDVHFEAITGELSHNDSAVYAYPNPAKDKIVVSVSSDEGYQNECTVYDLSGRFIEKIKLLNNDNKTIEIDISEYPTGNYLLQIVSDEKINFVKFLKY